MTQYYCYILYRCVESDDGEKIVDRIVSIHKSNEGVTKAKSLKELHVREDNMYYYYQKYELEE